MGWTHCGHDPYNSDTLSILCTFNMALENYVEEVVNVVVRSSKIGSGSGGNFATGSSSW